MRLVGLACIVSGWVVAVSGLFVTSANSGRIIFAVLGIGLSLFGILGVLNGYYLERAIWKR